MLIGSTGTCDRNEYTLDVTEDLQAGKTGSGGGGQKCPLFLVLSESYLLKKIVFIY